MHGTLQEKLAGCECLHGLTANVKKGQRHVVFEEEQGIPEKIEDKLQCPEAEGSTLCGPATVGPDLPPSIAHDDVQHSPHRSKQKGGWLPLWLVQCLVPARSAECGHEAAAYISW